MKNIILIIGLFINLCLNSQEFNLRTYKPISKSYFFIGDVLYSKINISVNTSKYSYLTGAKKVVYTGTRNHVFSINGPGGFTVSDLEITTDSAGVAICGLNINDSGIVSVNNVKIHDVQYGIRAFKGFQSKKIFNNVEIYNCEHDGICSENTNDWELNNVWVHNVNTISPSSDGDCVQIAYRNNNISIKNSVLDHSSTQGKFCLIIGVGKVPMGRLTIENTTFLGRYFNHTGEVSNSGLYVNSKPYISVTGCTFKNGANAIYESGNYPSLVSISNNFFIGQWEMIGFTLTFVNTFKNNTLAMAGSKYFIGSANGDSLIKNLIYTSGASTEFYSNKPAYVDNQVVSRLSGNYGSDISVPGFEPFKCDTSEQVTLRALNNQLIKFNEHISILNSELDDSVRNVSNRYEFLKKSFDKLTDSLIFGDSIEYNRDTIYLKVNTVNPSMVKIVIFDSDNDRLYLEKRNDELQYFIMDDKKTRASGFLRLK
jgi:hypothetical protein